MTLRLLKFALAVGLLSLVFCGMLGAQSAELMGDGRPRPSDFAESTTASSIRPAPQSSVRLSHQRILARQKWQLSGRSIPAANSAALRARALQQKLQMRSAQPRNTGGLSGGWVSLGPKPLPSDASGAGLQDYGFVAGRATAVAIDPNDPSGNTVFAGGAYGGVWKSANAGNFDPSTVTWAPLTDNAATLAVGSIAVQPQLSNPNPASSVVLVGTGETDSSTDSYYGLGILRSNDGGQNWSLISQDSTKTHSFSGLGFSQIAFSTANPNLVVAAAGSATQGIIEARENPVSVNRGLYYSTDAGVNWQAANVLDSGIAITPDSATAVVYNAAAGKFYAAIRNHGFYSSPDGVTWNPLPNQPGAGLVSTQCPAQEVSPETCAIYRGEIAVVPNRPAFSGDGEMYVWFVDANDNDRGIWTTLDGGVSWTQINDSGITNCGDLFGGCGTENGTFNLTLAAVPDGTATDLYAGAVNVYKCVITNSFPTCNGSGKNSFLNLTHAFGCSEIAKFHPGQHAMDFLGQYSAIPPTQTGTSLLYFANDGGIYRALDGYTGLTSGACGQANAFDNLNQNLGPMTQFVSMSESTSDVNLIFGGTQDNGAPATIFSQSQGAWVNVNAGDNGFTAINPSNDTEWFLAAPPDPISGVNLFRCANGVSCHTLDFQDNQIADSSSLNGDTGPFYLPFILDPQNSGELILGTCRIWRGATSGQNFSLLSPDLETGGAGSCSGSEINMVRAIAAGGLKDPSGFSQVIYAGTSGDGPLISTTPIGGHVWVTTNADGGPTAWNDVTQSINPLGFPISSIALDQTDPLGKTAYVGIMGFATSHVWKTINAGASWTDFTGNLPNVPVNSIIVDSGASLSNGTVYIGTDIGVFSSSTGSPNWTEVAPTSTESGFLPNVAVTSLQIFNSGGLKRLRAATYGRGIWEWNLITTPDFELTVSNNPQTIFPGQTAVFNGEIFALNGYSSLVNLTCASAGTDFPPTCGINPLSATPNAGGSSFSLSAGGNPGDYSFNLHAVGTDAATITHDFPLTLHIVDFTVSAPSPSSVTLAPANTSAPISLQVSALGSFGASVSLSCSNLPAGATCQFQPTSVAPANTKPATVTLKISASGTAATGSYPITISATTSGEAPKTQTLNLIISSTPDFTLTVSNLSVNAVAGAQVSFTGTLTAVNGYSNPIALSCGTNAPTICTPNPASVVTSATGTPFTITVSSNTAQTYNFNIVAKGTDSSATTHSVPVSFTATPNDTFNFSITPPPAPVTAKDGQLASIAFTLVPTTTTFPSDVTFQVSVQSSNCPSNNCGTCPPLSTCSFDREVQSGSPSTIVNYEIQTLAAVSAEARYKSMFSLACFLLPGILLLGPPSSSRRKLCVLVLIAIVALALASCGGGLQGNGGGGSGSPGTPTGNYTITVTATCASITPPPAQATLTITP